MTSYDNEQVIQVVEDALFEDSLGNRANNNILNFYFELFLSKMEIPCKMCLSYQGHCG